VTVILKNDASVRGISQTCIVGRRRKIDLIRKPISRKRNDKHM